MRPTRAALLPLAVIAVIAGTACSNSESGTPEAEGASTSQAPSSTATNPSTANGTAAASPLSGTDPCSLLNKSDAAQFGPVEEPQRKDVGTADTCEWSADRSQESGDRASVSLAIRENAGVQDMNDTGMGVQHTSENGRDYARSPSPTGCTIAIGVTDTSRVDVLVTASDIDKACEMANTLVDVVEPKVPQG